MIIKTFIDKGASNTIYVTKDQEISVSVLISNDFDGILRLRRTQDGGLSYDVTVFRVSTLSEVLKLGAGLYDFSVDYGQGFGSLTGTATITLDINDQTNVVSASSIWVPNAQPANGAIVYTASQVGIQITLKVVLLAARIPVTRSAAGSFGSIPLFNIIEDALNYLGCKQRYDGFVEGAALTSGAGDAAFEIGVGTSPITVEADGVLEFHEQNIGSALSQVNVSGTSSGKKVTTGIDVDGTTSNASLYLNFSGTAATILANSSIDVTGEINILVNVL